MRTVTFSNPSVRSVLKNNFVCTYTNLEGDPTAGQSIRHRPNDPVGNCIRGNGKQNVQTLFLTPEGEVYHVATGFLSPEDFSEECRFAVQLFREYRKDPSTFRQTVIDAHRDRLKNQGFSDRLIESANPMMAMMQGMQNGMGNSQNPFGSFIRNQMLQDGQFSIRHPLITADQIQRDPTPLVGNGKSFFASSSNGGGGMQIGPEGFQGQIQFPRPDSDR